MGSATVGFKKLHVGIFDDKAEKIITRMTSKLVANILCSETS